MEYKVELIKMNVIEDVIILGAGASKSERAPLQHKWFKVFFNSHEKLNHLLPEQKERIFNYFENFWGINQAQNPHFPTVEECLGMLDLAVNRDESFKDYSSNPNNPQIQVIREDLITLIAVIIDKKLRDRRTKYHKIEEYHKTLVNRLADEENLLKTGFVSLNYDILIDNALCDLSPRYDLDYGVEFTNFEKQDNWKRPEPQKSVFLYKPHGSLNYMYCPTCISLTLILNEERVATLRFKPQNCDACGSKMIPIIIPPTFFKVMSNFYLQEIWHKTENLLKQAKRIFFCGYSFSDADMHFKYMLKRVEMFRGETPQIYVINNHSEKKAKEEEEKRFRRFFRDKDKICYTPLSFEEFCETGIPNNYKNCRVESRGR